MAAEPFFSKECFFKISLVQIRRELIGAWGKGDGACKPRARGLILFL